MLKNSRLATLILRQILMVILSFSLFWGGIALLVLRIPGWGLFLGLPATSIGIVFVIFTLDGIARELFVPPHYITTKCQECGRTTFVKEGEVKICGRCREKEIEELLKER